jgi:hypothetical protein
MRCLIRVPFGVGTSFAIPRFRHWPVQPESVVFGTPAFFATSVLVRFPSHSSNAFRCLVVTSAAVTVSRTEGIAAARNHRSCSSATSSCLSRTSSGTRAHFFDPPPFFFFEPDCARSTIFRTASGLLPTTTAMSAFPNPALERMISVGSLESGLWEPLSAARRAKSASRAGSVGVGSAFIRPDPTICIRESALPPGAQEDHGRRVQQGARGQCFRPCRSIWQAAVGDRPRRPTFRPSGRRSKQ